MCNMVGNLEGRCFLGGILILTSCRRTCLLFICEIKKTCVCKTKGRRIFASVLSAQDLGCVCK